MAQSESSRRLAAILFTDIAGYTLLMQRDESRALEAVRKHQQVLEQHVPAHHGSIYQFYGDGSLSTFASATDAVQCAWTVQKHLLADPEVPVRMGLHIGEIYTEDGKIFGDGVNLASRIESIGQPGTVLFSKDVYGKIKNHPEFELKFIGTFEFKNVEEPVEVFALANPEVRFPDVTKIEGKLKEQKRRVRHKWLAYGLGLVLTLAVISAVYLFPREARTTPDQAYLTSIAVLPFKNQSDIAENYLSIGIAEDILTQLARIQGIRVIARSSSLSYSADEEDKPYREIGKELGVANLLAGTVRQVDATIKVTVRLIDAGQESIVWADEYQRELKDVLSVQQDIATMVAEKLKVELTPQLRGQMNEETEVHPDAYIQYLKGQEALLRSSGSQREVQNAITHFENALAIDSAFSKAWVGLADANLESIFWHRATDGAALPRATVAAVTALKLDPGSAEAHAALGAVDLYSHNLRSAEENLLKAIKLNPNCAFAYERLAWVKYYTGQPVEGFELLEKSIQLDPLSTRYKGGLINGYYITKQYAKGIARAQEFLKAHPDDNFLLWALAYMYAGNGDCEKAIETLDRRTIGRKTNWVYAYCHSKLGNMAAAQEVLDTLIARDARGFVPDFMMASAYAAVGDNSNAILRLEHATGIGGESFFAWGLAQDPMFASLRGEPRFQKVVQRIKDIYQ